MAGLLIDWAASLIVATAFFGIAALQGHGWQMWTPLLTYFLQKSAFTAIAGGSFGQLIAGVGVMRTDGRRLSVGLSIARSALVCLVIPAVVIGPNRRGLHDVLLGTIPVKTR